MSNDGAGGFPTAPGDSNDGSGFPPAPNHIDQPTVPVQQPVGQYDTQPPAQYYGQAPPAPGSGAPPTPPMYAAPPGYVPAGVVGSVKPPRPDVKVGGILVVIGALITGLAVFLPWLSADAGNLNGMDDFISADDLTLYESPGTVSLFFGAVLLGLGITLIAAGRVLAVAIIAIVVSTLTVLTGAFMVSLASDTSSFADDGTVGIGAVLQPIAPLLSLAGAIAATSKRRKMVQPGTVQAPYPG